MIFSPANTDIFPASYVGEVDLCEVLSQYWCSKQCNLLQLNSSSYNPIPREGGGEGQICKYFVNFLQKHLSEEASTILKI